MVNLITRMVHMEIVWRLYGESLENDTFMEILCCN